MNKESFFTALKECSVESHFLDFCRKHYLHGTPFVFNGDENLYFEFKKRIATKFQVNFYDVFIVGSAKFGFSPYKKGADFSYDSDIDVAIVSNKLFDVYLDHIMNFQYNLRQNRRAITKGEQFKYHEFLEYVAIGWMRPDKLPLSFDINIIREDWFDYFRSISNNKSEVGNYQVNGGLYKSYAHLEKYLSLGLNNIGGIINV